jgi:hypothetical protein
MEDLDIAAEREQMERDYLVAQIRRHPGSGLIACGECHFCAEPVSSNRLFCNSECAEDHEHESNRRAKRQVGE